MITTSPDDIRCEIHMKHGLKNNIVVDCSQCKEMYTKVKKFQQHNHSFTCAKKKKIMTIKKNEGHGRLDGTKIGDELRKLSVCRFQFPRFPMSKTTLLKGLSKDMDEDAVATRKKDLRKIITFLIRQSNETKSFQKLKAMNFDEFLYAVGMFKGKKILCEFTAEEKLSATQRYLNALSASIKGTAKVFLKRRVEDIFVNGFNVKIMAIYQANHDLQIVVDQHGCVQYMTGYVTKSEEGMSRLCRAINEESSNLKQVDKINAFAKVLDKNREISIQESIYRLMGLQMTKSSIKVKYISTVHPHFQDGLLKGNIEELDDNESVFHMSPHQYYEVRPLESSNQDKILYAEDELQSKYWDNLCFAEFWSKYEIVYGKISSNPKQKKTKLIPLQNNKGFIRKRSEVAVLRYYLNYTNDEDLARGLLILFMPFRDEMSEIHRKNVKSLLEESRSLVEEKRKLFEKYKVMEELIASIEKEESKDESEDEEQIDDDNEGEIETTSAVDIESFNRWARSQATKDLSQFKSMSDVGDISDLRQKVSSLNFQQRRIFDDIVERMSSHDIDEKPFYLFLSGNAGTGKSFLLKLIIEAVKHINLKPGDDLKKPSVITMAPTANAAFIIGGKTIDSVLGFMPSDSNHYAKASAGKMATMKHSFEDVKLIVCDEISMVGASKLLKINYRLQDLSHGYKSKEYMGGISFLASG